MDWLKRWHDDDGYHIDLINATPTRTPLLEVSKRVITEIVNKYPGPYYLMLSGGVDSQTMLWCWQNSGVPFIPTSMKYVAHDNKTVLNAHDLTQLSEYATQFDLNITYRYFRIQHFLENELENYAKKYICTSPQLTAHMAMSEQIKDGTVIFSGNFINHGLYNYTVLGLERYSILSNRSIIPFFLMHDPELATITAQFEEAYMQKPKLGAYLKKVYLLTELGVPIIPQPQKQTGFETLKDIYDDYPITFLERIKYSKKDSKRKFDIFFRYRLADKIRYIDEVTYHNKTSIQIPRNLNNRIPNETKY